MLQYRINRTRTNDLAGLPNTPGLPHKPGLPQDGGLPGSHSKKFKKNMKLYNQLHIRPQDGNPDDEHKEGNAWGVFGDTSEDGDIAKALSDKNTKFFENYRDKPRVYIETKLIPHLTNLLNVSGINADGSTNMDGGYRETWEKHPELRKRGNKFIAELHKIRKHQKDTYSVDNIFK